MGKMIKAVKLVFLPHPLSLFLSFTSGCEGHFQVSRYLMPPHPDNSLWFREAFLVKPVLSYLSQRKSGHH